jgi:hypothetical protein
MFFLQNIYSTTFVDFLKPQGTPSVRKHTSFCHCNVGIFQTHSLASKQFTGNIATKLLQRATEERNYNYIKCNNLIPIILIFTEETEQVLNSIHK